MDIFIIPRGQPTPNQGGSRAYLHVDQWDDFSFKTMFYLSLHDEKGTYHEISSVKIGFKGQATGEHTRSSLDDEFQSLPDGYFSLGQDVEYYQKLSELPRRIREGLLKSLKDIVFSSDLLETCQKENVFGTSLLRSVSLSVVKGQYSRVLAGQPPLTNFKFRFLRTDAEKMSGIDLKFEVEIDSKPSTNIHAIIGRNGVGKTTILNGMINAVTNKSQTEAKFYSIDRWIEQPIANDYFSSLVSVSFSAFDPFEPPQEQPDPSLGTCYFYIGLKKNGDSLKGVSDIHQDFLQALKSCFSQNSKRDRWLKAINTLESDENFAHMGLKGLVEFSGKELTTKALKRIGKMSTGHAVVLLTITKLVATVEEKTLVLIDEPESHLHPPLLSAFVRALSELLHDRNGVSIIATHSPVVMQEVPKSCVWKINRINLVTEPYRPDIETFGENVGVLTREVFGLEVTKSGYHDLLVKSVQSGDSYEQIVEEYGDQLGLEARAILKALVTHRDRSAG